MREPSISEKMKIGNKMKIKNAVPFDNAFDISDYQSSRDSRFDVLFGSRRIGIPGATQLLTLLPNRRTDLLDHAFIKVKQIGGKLFLTLTVCYESRFSRSQWHEQVTDAQEDFCSTVATT